MPVPTIAEFTDLELEQTQLALALACGRSHQGLRHQRKQWYCFLFQVLDIERATRGLPAPQPPYHAGDLKAGPSL